MIQPSWGDTFPNVGAECAAGVAGIVGALGEVAASGTLAMTSCKEFPMAGVANGRGWADTWMCQEVIKWLVNGLLCLYAYTYTWDILGL